MVQVVSAALAFIQAVCSVQIQLVWNVVLAIRSVDPAVPTVNLSYLDANFAPILQFVHCVSESITW